MTSFLNPFIMFPAAPSRPRIVTLIVSLFSHHLANCRPALEVNLSITTSTVSTTATTTTTYATTTTAATGTSTKTAYPDTGGISAPFSMAAESAITFVSVFIIGCVIVFTVYSWKKLSPAHWRQTQLIKLNILTIVFLLGYEPSVTNRFEYKVAQGKRCVFL